MTIPLAVIRWFTRLFCVTLPADPSTHNHFCAIAIIIEPLVNSINQMKYIYIYLRIVIITRYLIYELRTTQGMLNAAWNIIRLLESNLFIVSNQEFKIGSCLCLTTMLTLATLLWPLLVSRICSKERNVNQVTENSKALEISKMGNGTSAGNKNGALKETMGDHDERYFGKIINLLLSKNLNGIFP